MGVAGADRDNPQWRRVGWESRTAETARDGCSERTDGSQFFRPLSRPRHAQDGALNFRLDLWALVHGDVGNAHATTEIDVRELAMKTSIGEHRRAPAR